MAQDFDIETEFSDGILRFTVSGKPDIRVGLEIAQRVEPNRAQYSPILILTDVRNAVMTLSVLEIEDVMRAVIKAQGYLNQRVAVLCSKDRRSQALKYDFLANIAKLIGISLNIFTDESHAIVWLKSKHS